MRIVVSKFGQLSRVPSKFRDASAAYETPIQESEGGKKARWESVNVYIHRHTTAILSIFGRPRRIHSKFRDASAAYETPEVGERRSRKKERWKSVYVYIWLYLDAEVLVLPPVFLPQDSVFVGRRLHRHPTPGRPFPSFFCLCWCGLSRAGFLSFPAPFSLRASISRSTGILGPLPVLLSYTHESVLSIWSIFGRPRGAPLIILGRIGGVQLGLTRSLLYIYW